MSGQNWIKRGSLPGTGANIKINTGFKPKRVSLFNEDGLATAEKTDTMLDDIAMKRVTAGTLTAADPAISFQADGFTILVDADLNVAGELLHWVAHQAEND